MGGLVTVLRISQRGRERDEVEFIELGKGE